MSTNPIRLRINFTDPEGVPYKIDIGDPNYKGTFIREVQGSAVLDYPKVDTMAMLRGSSLNMQLEASLDTSYYSFLYNTIGDAQLPVTLYRNGVIFWTGFIKPDGIVESFVTDYWYINIQAIDGLGYLENVQFLDSNKQQYFGPQNELLLLARCLQLTGSKIDFRLYDFNLYFTTNSDGPILTNKPITDTYVNTDRYVKTDNSNTVFTVKEVLESILKKYGAYVVQENGKWNIIRLENYFSEATQMVFTEYDFNGVTTGVQEAPNRIKLLGSQINGYYPHHANANQQKYYNVSLGAYKVIYEYGLVKSIVLNNNLYFNNDQGDIDYWEITDNDFQISTQFRFGDIDLTPPGYPNGYYIGSMYPVKYDKNYLALKTTTNQRVQDNVSLEISISGIITMLRSGGNMIQFVQISIIGDSGVRYTLTQEGEWVNTSVPGNTETKVKIFDIDIVSLNNTYDVPYLFEGTTVGTPETGELEVWFYLPQIPADFVNFKWSRVKEINITQNNNGIKGESHTATRGKEELEYRTVTAVVEDDGNIYVGDNPLTDVYVGGIEDITTANTLRWSKRFINTNIIDSSNQYELLQWMVTDRLQISSGNALKFSGGIYGYFPYLGVITIDNIGNDAEPVTLDKFITSKWTYDLALNVISAEFERIYNNDISQDVTYNKELETDNTVIKPAIKG